MELTKSELEIAERHLAKRERELAQWPRKRWVMLVVYSVAMLVGVLIVNGGKRSIYEDQNMEAEFRRALGKEGPPPGMEERWLMGSILKIGNVMEVRHQVVTLSLMQMAVGCLPFFSGLTMVTIVILRWNGGERDALICKLLRAKLRELEQTAATMS
jgi:hypothetical protein